jgi:hypothetical protein
MKKLKIILMLAFVSTALLRAQTWQSIGPVNRTGPGSSPGQGSGIITTIVCHPKYNTHYPTAGDPINKTVFAGSPFGGIWISTDDGNSWSTSNGAYPNLTTDFYRGCGVRDIVIDPNSPTTMYAAFASSERSRNYLYMGNNYPSTGIYKYTPATGWQAVLTYPYLSNHTISELQLSPSNSNVLFACTDDGVIKLTYSTSTWTSTTVVSSGIGHPFRNLLFDPNNTSNAFASGQDVYKSTDGGNSFTNISNFTSAQLPGLVDPIILTNITVLSSTAVYARVHYVDKTNPDPRYQPKTEKFFRYNGSTWTPLPMFSWARAEYNYDRMPMLAKKIGTTEYVFGGSEIMNLYNSSITGGTFPWQPISTYAGDMHADIHDIVFSPDGGTLFVAHDGGISKATTNLYTTPAWITINNGLSIATVLSFSGSQKNPDIILTGEHDNGNSIIKNATAATPSWNGYYVCDGGDKMVSVDNPNEWYDRSEQYGGASIHRNSDGNENNNLSSATIFSTISPITTNVDHAVFEEFGDKKIMVMDPNNPNIVYKGTNILLRSMDKGDNSQILFRKNDCFETSIYDPHSHINCIAIAPTNSNYLYINFYNPYSFEPQYNSHIYKTTNALTGTYAAPCLHVPAANEGVVCGNWTDLTPNFGFPGVKFVSNAVVVSDKDPNVIWVGYDYNTSVPAANRKDYLVWKYDGANWSNWGAGLPDNTSITSLVYEKGSNDGIYAGTDVGGVFYRSNTTGGWISYGSAMPHAYVNQLEINNTENTIRAGAYGRGIWKNSLYCPTVAFASPDPCTECNGPNYFWEGTNVTIANATLTVNKQFVRARDYIDILPTTTITASATATYDFYIHGCGPSQKNSYREINGSDSDDDHLTIDSGEDDEEEETAMSVYPNPNNGAFTLNTGNSEEKDIYVYDVLGKVVFQKNKVTEKTTEINIAGSPKGVYMVKIICDDKNQTIKIIHH